MERECNGLNEKMEIKDDGESQEEHPSSPLAVLQSISEEIFKAAGEALTSVYTDHSALHPMPPIPSHRRSQSEVITAGHKQNNGLTRLKSHMQKALRWGSNSRDQAYIPSFNPEVLANQKRQWYQRHSKTMDETKYKEPTSLFEHLVIVGLHPDANLAAAEDAFGRRKKWELDMAKSGIMDYRTIQRTGPSPPTFEPQILFKYPPRKRLPIRPKDLNAFCFPAGVKPRLLERTPSLSDLNELVYGQEHVNRDDLAFMFSLKVADNQTLYGICLHVTEIVQRPPGILGNMSPLSESPGQCSRFLFSGLRCYCVLTRVPFFELHYEMLNSIISQERLNRITQFVSEISLSSCIPPALKQHDQSDGNADLRVRQYGMDWTAFAIPVDSAVALTAAAAGIISDDEVSTLSTKISEPCSPESVTASEASDFGHAREVDKEYKKMLYLDDSASECSESRTDGLERTYSGYENGHTSPDVGIHSCATSPALECLGNFDTLFSPARSLISEAEDEDDEMFSNYEKDFGDDLIMEWARENKNDLLQIVCAYHSMALPERGSEIVFQPLEHLQAISYERPPVSALGIHDSFQDLFEASEVNAKLAAAEEALSLSIWTTATLCRVLSLESLLALIAGVLLEKQVVLVCPNLGVLSAAVLSIVPLIRPFQWQSLFLPVLPEKMLDFLDAPVPFVVGIQHKPADLRIKSANLVHVNILKDQVKTYHLPTLPHYKELVSELAPIHARLSYQSSVARRHPVYRCNEVQAEAAAKFLTVMRRYMESLCSDLRFHTITSVQSNNDRVSLLLKDSYIDSFPSRERPFVKLLVDTQLFAALSDCRLTSFESGRM